jgi:tetratricopeptide (TPR) repeat protein
MGVVHRDIKPSNLMLDVRGKVWITDFGLAHRDRAAQLTLTGDLVGTLRYMSPEQALAKRVPIDHRSDVYSLGVTLYELLTLEPAVGGKDRQELMQQIAFEEPRPPRQLCREVPPDLETIVMKAMEKNPHDRYATAAELAEDLRHWLADQPIRARRPGVVQRLRKWGRRHQGVVVTASLGLLLALAVVAGSIGWVVRDQAARQKEAEQPVQAAMDEAERLLKERKVREALSAALRAEGLVIHAGGHPQLGPQVQQLLKDLRMLVTLEEVQLNWSAVKDGKFDKAGADQGYTKAFQDSGIDVDALTVEVAATRIRACRIGTELAAALDSWAVTRSVKKGGGRLLVVARAVDPDEWRGRLRDVLESRGEKALAELARLEKADALPASTLAQVVWVVREKPGALAKVVPLLQRAQQKQPDDFWVNHNLAFALQHMEPSHLDEAIGFYRVAVALRPGSPGARLNLGAALKDKGQLDEASAAHREAIRLKPDHANAHLNLGNALQAKGRLDEAILAYREAIRLKPDYTEAHYSLGVALAANNRLDDAICAYKETIRLRPDYAEAHCNLGEAMQRKGQFAEALVHRRRGHELGSKRSDWPYPSALWVKHCERLVELDRKLPAILSGKERPKDPVEQIQYAQLCQLPFKRLYASAARLYQQALAAQPSLADNPPTGLRYNAACAAALAAAGQGQDTAKLEAAERERWRRQALDWLRADLALWTRQAQSTTPPGPRPGAADPGSLAEGQRPGWRPRQGGAGETASGGARSLAAALAGGRGPAAARRESAQAEKPRPALKHTLWVRQDARNRIRDSSPFRGL